MKSEGRAQTQTALSKLIGQRLFRTQHFCATRHFDFGGGPDSEVGTARNYYTLGVECPWRFVKGDLVIVGLEDYGEEAGEPTRGESGMPMGDLQDQKLAEMLGELKEGDIYNTQSGFIVETVEVDDFGGFKIHFTNEYAFEVFPASCKLMEWILLVPSGEMGLILMNGEPNLTKQQSVPKREKGSAS